MRVLTVVAVMVVLLELLLGFAFFAGYWWLGGWQPGLLLSAGLLLLIAVKWMGNLDLHYDSEAARLSMRLTWWGAVTLTMKPQRLIEVRILGIPWRKQLKPKEPEEEVEEEEQAERRRERRREFMRKAGANWQEMVGLLPAGMQMANDLFWEARELKVEVQAPTGNDFADGAIAAVVGHRGLGPVDVRCTATGERRVRVHYRIGLLRATLCALYVGIQALPWLLKARAREKQQEQEQIEQASIEPKEAE